MIASTTKTSSNVKARRSAGPETATRNDLREEE
jgi:hypothetical protein